MAQWLGVGHQDLAGASTPAWLLTVLAGVLLAGCGPDPESAITKPVENPHPETRTDVVEPEASPALETKLFAQQKALDAALSAKPFDPAKIRAAAIPLRDSAAVLAEQYRQQGLAGKNVDLAALLKNRAAPAVKASADLTHAIYGAATVDQLRRCYAEQIRAEGAAAAGLVANDKAVTGLWMYWGDSQDGREAGLPFFRAESLRDCLNDLIKYCDLLERTDAPVRLQADTAIFADDFKTLRPDWQKFGAAEITVTDGQLTIQGEACTLWLAHDFENAVIAFDYTPLTLKPRAGALFAFPGRPLPGFDWSDSAGAMHHYNIKIETYHASLCRGGSGMTNLRRTGTGLRMLSTVVPDPCAELLKTYRVELLTWNGMAQVYVDGNLIHAYPDAGVYGPELHKGRFGLRLFAGGEMSMRIAQFSIRSLPLKRPRPGAITE